MKIIIFLGLATLVGAVIESNDKKELAVADSIDYLCNNMSNEMLGKKQSLGRCYNRFFVCSEVDGKRVWEWMSCDECMRFDEDVGECRLQSQIVKCQIDADGFDILDIDDVLLACDKLAIKEPVVSANPNKACSNVYMQCAMNSMGVEDEYNIIAGGVFYCNNSSLAFDIKSEECQPRELVDACIQSPSDLNVDQTNPNGVSRYERQAEIIENSSVEPTYHIGTGFNLPLLDEQVDSSSVEPTYIVGEPVVFEDEFTFEDAPGTNESSVEAELVRRKRESANSTVASIVNPESLTPFNESSVEAELVRRKRESANSTVASVDEAYEVPSNQPRSRRYISLIEEEDNTTEQPVEASSAEANTPNSAEFVNSTEANVVQI